ncbi:MAG: hypothetical protein GKC02_08080 [Methanomassiliicoccales archaeon]|nr:hypothetical protein [Methanomassiliicoccales archaeon]
MKRAVDSSITTKGIIAVFAILLVLQIIPSSVGQDHTKSIQLLEGGIEPYGFDAYILPSLDSNDTLYVYMNGTSGDLDPFIVLTNSSANLTDILILFKERIAEAIENGQDYHMAITETANQLFPAWDDDSGWGYAATFEWNISEDGDYKLVAIGAPLTGTFGFYSLLVGLNSPEILNGTGVPTGDIIAALNPEESTGRVGVQEFTGSLDSTNGSKSYTLAEIFKDDVLYIFIETTSDHDVPWVTLYDFGGKSLRTANESQDRSNATLAYTFDGDCCNYRIEVSEVIEDDNISIDFRLLVGLNQPDVLTGNATLGGRNVIVASIPVKVGIELDQITSVDQTAENYAIVANLWMQWNDPRLAFNPDLYQGSNRIFRSVDDFVNAYGELWPEFTIFNQQGNRWTQNLIILVESNGTASYVERFWTTLQAPDFDFRNFPFDTQRFYIRILCLYSEEVYHYVAWDDKNSVGDQLGEEEWFITSHNTEVTTVEFNKFSSMFSFGFVAERHISYYAIRILVPIIIILGLTWVTWSIRDYGRRIAVATGNLLLFIAFSFTIGDDLPKLGYLTTMDKILISTFIWTAIVVAYNFYLNRLEEKKRSELSLKIDRFLVWTFPFAFLLTYLIISWIFP